MMNRRIFISSLAALPFLKPAFAANPWNAEFVAGSFDGRTYQAGLVINLDHGWKTYWRNPGSSGIPPSIDVKGGNLQDFTIDFPMPARSVDESGEAIGYHDEVMFIIHLKPKDATMPLDVELSSFFGVCEKICTPAKFDGKLNFTPNMITSPNDGTISNWQGMVPRSAKIVSNAKIEGKTLTLNVKQSVKDIFVEGPDAYYFRAPKFNIHGSEAKFVVDGLKNASDLIGKEIRLTFDAMGVGLEQRVTVT